jgi:hypothetical protein
MVILLQDNYIGADLRMAFADVIANNHRPIPLQHSKYGYLFAREIERRAAIRESFSFIMSA